MGQQTGDAVSVQIVVIRHFADLAALPRPAGEVVPVGDGEAAVPHQVFKEEQIGSLRVVADVHVVGEGEEHIRFPFRHAVPSGGFRLHHRRVDIAVGGAVNPDGVFPAIGAVNDESGPPLVTVHGVAGQGRFLRLIGRQAAEGNGHPGLLIRIGKGGGHVAVQQQVGHEPVLPVPPIQQGDALVGLAAVIEILPVELDIIAPPLAAGEGDGAVIGVPVGVVVGVILRQVVKGVQIHLIGLGQRQTGVLQQESVHIRPGKLVGGADLAAVLRQHPQLFQFLLTGRLPDSAAVIEQVVQVDLLGRVVQAGEELVVGIGPHHAVNIRVVIEKFRVEEGQLLPGEGTGHPQQVIRPAADLVGEDAEPAAGLRFHRNLCPDLFPGTGGVYQIHAALLRLVVKGHGIAAALSGIEADGAGGVGVSMEMVIGVVVRKVGEAAHIQRVSLRQRQSRPPGQNGVRLLCGDFDEIHLRIAAAVVGVRHLLPLRIGDGLFRRDAVVKQLVHVYAPRLVIDGGQKLDGTEAAVIPGRVLPAVSRVERQRVPGQLLAGQRPHGGLCPGEGEGAYQRGGGHHRQQSDAHSAAVLRNAGNPVFQLLFPRRHGSGGEHGALRPPGHRNQPQQRLAVGDALRLAQPLQGTLVAGQLAVPAGHNGGNPHQRVEPVHRQTHAPQQAPQGVQMAGVGGLVDQNMPQGLRGFHGGGGQVDGGVKQAEQTGGGQIRRQIHRIGAVFHRVRFPAPAETEHEAEVRKQEPRRHDIHPGVPDGFQNGGQRDLTFILDGMGDIFPVGKRHGAVLCGGVHPEGLIGGGGLEDARRGGDNGLPVGGHIQGRGGDPGRHRLRRRQDVVLHGGQADRHQQPQRHQPPQGVLHLAGDGFSEQQPQKQQGKDQNGRSQQDLFHGFPPAFSKMADSSAMSFSVRAFFSTMALISRPSPPILSKKVSVSDSMASSRSTAGKYSLARRPSSWRTASLPSRRESMVMTVFFDQPVSSRKAAVSSVMVMGEVCHRRFISFHSLLERSIFMVHLAWYTVVYLLHHQRSKKVDKCQPQFDYKTDTEKSAVPPLTAAAFCRKIEVSLRKQRERRTV